MNTIWRKNDVYLDIGSFAMGAGWMTLHMGSVMFLAISVWIAASGDIWLSLAILAVLGVGVMGTLWYLFIKQWRKPFYSPIRFNRHRRQVLITEPGGEYWLAVALSSCNRPLKVRAQFALGRRECRPNDPFPAFDDLVLPQPAARDWVAFNPRLLPDDSDVDGSAPYWLTSLSERAPL
ncbi:hypothetical protein [Halopseudomonas maritima]|uniref:hypothetical protein n=1 Tax=Halopseudomonas maritima TaxID=2918528 RepID=UPI001EEAD12D|nr:hypothetical protein [Halopseudomonas maritima]UJJ31312.1 hypothetical protein HV822_16400 [Halopseudomonas maritima]